MSPEDFLFVTCVLFTRESGLGGSTVPEEGVVLFQSLVAPSQMAAFGWSLTADKTSQMDRRHV